MKKLIMGASVFILLIPLTAWSQDWTKEQQEVLAFEEACITTKSVDEFKDCFHRDYAGWGIDSTVVLTKNDILKIIEDGFATTESETLLFKPVSVIVKGDTAVVSYVQGGKVTDKRTNEVEYYTQRWTDVCIKDRGRWYWISDHGVNISTD